MTDVLPGSSVFQCSFIGVTDAFFVPDRVSLESIRRKQKESVRRWIDLLCYHHPEIEFVDQVQRCHVYERSTFNKITHNNVLKLLAEHGNKLTQ